MNAAAFNARNPIGSPVFAYPGFRPEDDADAPRLVTRTRTIAQQSASGHDVIWVDGEGAYISLTHVDPVTEAEWQAAKGTESEPGEVQYGIDVRRAEYALAQRVKAELADPERIPDGDELRQTINDRLTGGAR